MRTEQQAKFISFRKITAKANPALIMETAIVCNKQHLSKNTNKKVNGYAWPFLFSLIDPTS
jgi:hypothetical protein